MKKIIILLVSLMFVMVSCGEPSSDSIQREQTEKLLKEANAQIGMPSITRFKEKKDLKALYELRDKEDLICYAYIVNKMTGKPIFFGKCIGYGLPYSVQFSNPEKRIRYSGGGGYLMPQAEPNGLFMPEGLSATWLMMVTKKGEVKPVYVEPEIIVSPFRL